MGVKGGAKFEFQELGRFDKEDAMAGWQVKKALRVVYRGAVASCTGKGEIRVGLRASVYKP